MKKISAFLFINILFVASCLADQKITVGVIAPLSGPLAEYGQAVNNGIRLFQKNEPALANQLNFIFEDSQWDAKKAIAAYNKLRNVDKVDLIFNWGNPTSEAIAPLAKKYQFPTMAMTLDAKVARGNPYLIRTTNPDYHFSKKLCEYLQDQNFSRLGVVIAENSYLKGLYNGLKQCLPEIKIIAEHNMSDNDFKTTIAKIRFANYDAIGVFLITGQISEFYKQYKTQGLKSPTFGTDFFESTTEIKGSAGGMEGAVYPHLAVSQEFKQQYLDTYHNDLQIAYAGNAYDVALYLAKSLTTVESDAEALLAALRNQQTFLGVTGEFSFQNSKNTGQFLSFPIVNKQIKNNKIEKLN